MNSLERSMMLNFKKTAKAEEVKELTIGTCPACQGYVSHLYFMSDASTKKQSKWYSCSCGVVWNVNKPTKVYDMKYWQERSAYDKKLDTAYSYPIRLYAPIIEELVYGRRVLLVGRPNDYQHDSFAKRGWVPTSIDKNTSFVNSSNLIAADFETHKFQESTKYNLIWFYHSLECLSDPIGSLAILPKLLAEDGILFIGTPDTDFINTRSSSSFIHWKHDENYLMWNRRSLTRHLEHLGFNVILARQNYEHRFPIWDDLHIIAQRKFF